MALVQLKFLFFNLCWIVFLFSLFRVSNSDPDPPPETSSAKNADGGLADKYAKNVVLADEEVTFFWTLSKDTLSIAARGTKKSGYLAIGFGTQMVDSYAYVGWVDETGKGKVSTYHIEGKSPDDIHPTKEKLTKASTKSEDGIITFEFTRVLDPKCKGDDKSIECGNVIDPAKPLKVIWAMGPKWSDKKLSKENIHFGVSSKPVSVSLVEGTSKAENRSIPLLLIFHGALMFLAWGILLPLGILSARYLKHHNDTKWFNLHLTFQYLGLAIVIIAFICIVLLLKKLEFDNWHIKFGFLAILLGITQPINAMFRPEKPLSWEEPSKKRIVWEYAHIICGRSSIIVAVVALLTGLKFLGEDYGNTFTYALIVWIILFAGAVICLELAERKRRRKEKEMKIGRQEYVQEKSMKIPM